MGVEGLDLTPQLNIPVRGRDIQAILLIDRNVSTCVDVNVWSKTGDFHFQPQFSNMKINSNIHN